MASNNQATSPAAPETAGSRAMHGMADAIREQQMYKTLLVPTDGSEQSDKAIAAAVDLAKQTGARLVALSVVEPYPFAPIAESPYIGGSQAYEQRALEVAQQNVAAIASSAKSAGVSCETVVEQALEPYEQILDTARIHSCDAIVMATHGRRGLNKLFAGSVTQKVIANAHVPVIVVR